MVKIIDNSRLTSKNDNNVYDYLEAMDVKINNRLDLKGRENKEGQ